MFVSEPRISVLIPLYRGKATIRACLESLVNQEGIELQILLLDNGCPEKTGEWAGFYLGSLDHPPEWRLFEEKTNTGFASGINRLYGSSDGPYICFLNQDVELRKDHLIILVSNLAENERMGGVCGTLLRPEIASGKKIIDTTGHVIFRDRIVRNRGAGIEFEKVESLYEGGEVFGLSAACSMFRREALEGCRESEGPFDPDFFSYFEDIDLDYRMHRAGWELHYVPEAVGTHVHAGSGARKELKVRLRAYGNRRRIMWKHESWGSLLPDILPILMQDTYGWIRALFTDPAAWLLGPWIFFIGIGRILKRRSNLDRRFGKERNWIRKWLKSESERVRDRR